MSPSSRTTRARPCLFEGARHQREQLSTPPPRPRGDPVVRQSVNPLVAPVSRARARAHVSMHACIVGGRTDARITRAYGCGHAGAGLRIRHGAALVPWRSVPRALMCVCDSCEPAAAPARTSASPDAACRLSRRRATASSSAARPLQPASLACPRPHCRGPPEVTSPETVVLYFFSTAHNLLPSNLCLW